MVKKVLVLLDKLLSAEVAILIEQIDLQDLLAVRCVSISEDVGDEEGEDVSESTVSDVGGEGVVVVWIKELHGGYGTSREEMPPAYAQYLLRSMTGNGIWSSHSAEWILNYGQEDWGWWWARGYEAWWNWQPQAVRAVAQLTDTSWHARPWREGDWRRLSLWARAVGWRWSSSPSILI